LHNSISRVPNLSPEGKAVSSRAECQPKRNTILRNKASARY
jgi:hypothetical protein